MDCCKAEGADCSEFDYDVSYTDPTVTDTIADGLINVITAVTNPVAAVVGDTINNIFG